MLFTTWTTFVKTWLLYNRENQLRKKDFSMWLVDFRTEVGYCLCKTESSTLSKIGKPFDTEKLM